MIRSVRAFSSGLWAALVAWILWAGSLEMVGPGDSADSPQFPYTSTSGKVFFVNFHARRVQ